MCIAAHGCGAPNDTGRSPFAHETMLRLPLLQQWVGLSDFAMEEALFDMPRHRTFAGLGNTDRLPDRISILRSGRASSPRHLMGENDLAKLFFETVSDMLRANGLMLQSVTVVDPTIIVAPCLTRHSTGKRDLEMHQTKKGDQCHYGMKADVGADAESGLLHAVVVTAANVNAVNQAHALVHGKAAHVYIDAGCQGVARREEVQDIGVNWPVTMRPGNRLALVEQSPLGAILDEIGQLKASIRAKVEHPLRVVKRQFGHTKVCYPGLKMNTAQFFTLFMLANPWVVRKRFMQTTV